MSRRAARLGPRDRVLAALAVLLGGGSLVLFVAFLVGADLTLARLGLGEPPRLSFDAGLCLFFFVQHSSMLRRSFRTRFARVVPSKLHGVVYTIASGVALALLVLLWQRSAVVLLAPPGAGRWILHGIQLAALAGLFWGWLALGCFDPFGVAALRVGRAERGKGPAPLTMRGPYGWVRHPLYLFFLVAAWATPVLTADRLLFNVLWTAWVAVGCVWEERDLVAVHGDAYRAYQRRVPMLVPWPRRASARPDERL